MEQAIPSPTERVAYFSNLLIHQDHPGARATAWLGLAGSHEAAGNLEEALNGYTHYAQLASKDERGWKKLAELSEGLGRWDLAAGAWQKVQIQTHGSPAKEAEAHCQIARLRAHLVAQPQDAQALLALAGRCKSLGRSDEAMSWYKSSVEADPTLLEAWWGYGSACQDVGDMATSTKVWQTLLGLPLSDAWRTRVEKKAQEVEILQGLSASQNPEDMARLASMYFTNKEYEKALSWIDKALIAEKRTPWFRARAQCLDALGRWDASIEAWRTYTAVETDEKALQEGLSKWVSSVTEEVRRLRIEGQYGHCLTLLEDLEKNPDFPADLRGSLRQEVLKSTVALEDPFPPGNVDVKWQRVQGSWVINMDRLEGSDGRLWTRDKFTGPIIAFVRVVPDLQFPRKTGHRRVHGSQDRTHLRVLVRVRRREESGPDLSAWQVAPAPPRSGGHAWGRARIGASRFGEVH